MTSEQEKEYWECLTDILMMYYQRIKRLERKIRRLQEELIWLKADKLTEVERVKKAFGLTYDPMLADRKTRDDLFEEFVEEREFQPASSSQMGRKIRPTEVLPQQLIADLKSQIG